MNECDKPNPLENELDLVSLQDAMQSIGANWQTWLHHATHQGSVLRSWCIYHALDELALNLRLPRKEVLRMLWKARYPCRTFRDRNGISNKLPRLLGDWPGKGAYDDEA